MIDANEESEIFESLGRVSRTAAAGTMQTAEMASRREQMSQSAKETEATDQQRHVETIQRLKDRGHQQEATLAQVMRSDAYQRHFWAHAGSEQIADYVTASAHLAPRHAEARSAYMHLSDVLRNDYGINIEQMNRDHPTSMMDRHHALREALDDYFYRNRLSTEADNATQQGDQGPEPLAADDDLSTEYQAQKETDQNADRPAGDEHELRAAAERAGKNEAETLADADRCGSEASRDAAHSQGEESTGGRQPHPYRRVSDADLEQLRDRDSQAAEVRGRTRNNFPEPTSARVFHQRGPATRGASSRGAQPQREIEVTR